MTELIDKYSPLVTYIGGIITGFIPFYIKGSIAKNNLIKLFMADIEKNWRNFDQLQHVFVGEWIVRSTFSFRGYDNLNISDELEYRFEICNIKMYETEGIKLLPLLGRQARLMFWEVITMMRDAENIRQMILSIDEADLRKQYQQLFVSIMKKLSSKFNDLYLILDRERPLICYPLGMLYFMRK